MREKVWVPLTDQIQKAMEVAETSVEAADYLAQRFRAILKQAKLLDKSQEMLARVDEYVAYVKFKLISNAQPWFGEAAKPSDFKIMQENIGNDAAQAFKAQEVAGSLRLDYAISEKGDFIRGYSVDGKALPNEALEQCDNLFNAWLADSGYVSKGSVLYPADEKGEILPEQGSPHERAATISDLIKEEYGNFLQEKGIPITIYQQTFPGEAQQKEAKAGITKAAESLADAVQKEDAEPQAPKTNL